MNAAQPPLSMNAAQPLKRSLGETLLAAGSSFALFAAFNWKEGNSITDGKLLERLLSAKPWLSAGLLKQKGADVELASNNIELKRKVQNGVKYFCFVLSAVFLVNSMFQPWYPWLAAVQNALHVWIMRKRMRHAGRAPDAGTLEIISLCPMFIQIPDTPEHAVEEQSLENHGFRIVDSLEGTCPLQLSPKSSSADDIPPSTVGPARYIYLRQACGRMANMRDSFSLKPPNLALRKAVMMAELEPEYEQLSFLRSGSPFRGIVTSLQAAGYILVVAVRFTHTLGVSPLEAWVGFLSVLAVIQLLTEIYACGRYRQPLLLRLTPAQFERFLNALKKDPRDNMPLHFRVMLMAGGLVQAVLIAAVPAHFFLNYYGNSHNKPCDSCRRAAKVFLAGAVVSIVPIAIFVFISQREARNLSLDSKGEDSDTGLRDNSTGAHARCNGMAALVTWISHLVYFISFVIAIWATIKHWMLFNMPVSRGIWVAWFLPHVSS